MKVYKKIKKNYCFCQPTPKNKKINKSLTTRFYIGGILFLVKL